MGRSILFVLPEELLLILVSHIVRRRDLINLALTSKAFYHIIVPSFLDVVHIRCDPRRNDIWQWLISKPHLAARVRMLELYHDITIPPIIPSSFRTHLNAYANIGTLEGHEQSLAAALVLMTWLHRFLWSGSLDSLPSLKLLLIPLGQQIDMDELHVNFDPNQDSDDEPDHEYDSDLDEPINVNRPINIQALSPVANFHNITTLYIHISQGFQFDGDAQSITPIWIMHLRNLNNLWLGCWGNCYFDFSVICEHAHWPCLVELSLDGNIVFPPDVQSDVSDKEDCGYSTVRFGNFIRSHPTLERLNIKGDNGGTDEGWVESIEPPTMAQLRSVIWYKKDHAPDPLRDWFSSDNPQRLQYLECGRISAESLPALRTMTSLRSVYAVDMDLRTFEQLVDAVPQLQQLHIPCQRWYTEYILDTPFVEIEGRVVNNLLKLKHLVQLEGLIQCRPPTYVFKNTIERLTEHESLLYIDSFTWEQLKQILGEWVLVVLLDRLAASSTIPSIQDSAGFHIVSGELLTE